MANRICSELDCDKPVRAKALCVTHYHRQNVATKANRPAPGICRGCGGQVPRGEAGPPKHYCSVDCRPRCDVDGCEKPRHGNAYCSAHHTRWRRTGNPLTPIKRQSNYEPRKPREPARKKACSVEGCDQPSRKRAWCASHYAQWRRHGMVRPFNYKWANEVACLACDLPIGQYRSRKYCSAACERYHRRHLEVPANPNCARCGVEVDLASGTKVRKRKRIDTKLCGRCKSQSRTEATPGELALRDGPYCQLCGCDVDLLAVFPDKMRPSVDHIIPRAWGGSDAASNNQLTHLLCNQTKSDRYEGVSSRTQPSVGQK